MMYCASRYALVGTRMQNGRFKIYLRVLDLHVNCYITTALYSRQADETHRMHGELLFAGKRRISQLR